MGSVHYATCRDCGYADFEVSQGGGFNFVLLRCDRCGRTKSVERAELNPRSTRLQRLFQRKKAKPAGAKTASPRESGAWVLSVGDWVTVTDGPSTNLTASVRLVDNQRRRLHVAVSLYGTDFTEELDFDQVEPIDNPCECGGTFVDCAPPRCPRCRSTSIELGRVKMHYD